MPAGSEVFQASDDSGLDGEEAEDRNLMLFGLFHLHWCNFTLLYILVTSCGTPMVYFMGIEENRTMAKEYFKSNMRIFQKKNKIKRKVFTSRFW